METPLEVNLLKNISTAKVFHNPKHYKTNLEELRRVSRKFAKKVNGSAHKQKAKLHLAKHHVRVTNFRKDTFHKITTYLCKNHARVVIEDLAVDNMVKNHKLA